MTLPQIQTSKFPTLNLLFSVYSHSTHDGFNMHFILLNSLHFIQLLKQCG
jgi:hypothetical protein